MDEYWYEIAVESKKFPIKQVIYADSMDYGPESRGNLAVSWKDNRHISWKYEHDDKTSGFFYVPWYLR